MPPIDKVPLFPLGLVLYPGEHLPLHIFEPQYKKMINECLEEDKVFGIVLMAEGKMARTGCSSRIERVLNRYEDDRMDIVVVGEDRFRILQLSSEKEYLTAEVEWIVEPEEELDREKKERAITQHMRLLELAGRTVRPTAYQGVRHVSYFLGANAGLQPQQKQKMLEMLTENERIAFLTDHFESLLPRVEKQEELRRLIQSNGHFKDFPEEE